MSDQPNLAEKVAGFATDATIDTGADGFINSAIDGIASHIPGGSAFDAVVKTGVDLEANNAINAELGKLEGEFGGH
jgi:hypothetical protein